MKTRILLVLLIIGVFLIYNSYSCILLEFTSTPSIFSKHSNIKVVAILYGYGVCGTCPTGRFVLSVKNDPDILFILPKDLNKYEIENFKREFEVKGIVERGDTELDEYLKKIASCQKKYRTDSSILIRLDKDGKIESMKRL